SRVLRSVLATAAFVTFVPVSQPASAAPLHDTYVALGDSFTAGSGIPSQATDACGRSGSNYPTGSCGTGPIALRRRVVRRRTEHRPGAPTARLWYDATDPGNDSKITVELANEWPLRGRAISERILGRLGGEQ